MGILNKDGLLFSLQKIKTLLLKKVDIFQGVENYGKVFTVNSEGNTDIASFPSQTDVVYDETKGRLVMTEKTNLPGNVFVDPLLLNEGDAADAKVTGDRFNKLSEDKADKSYVISIFEQLKELIQAGQTTQAVALLDSAILDLSTLG